MTQEDDLALLRESLARLAEAERWLRRSHAQCSQIDISGSLSDPEFDAFETLTSRFARVSDMVLQKVFRSIEGLSHLRNLLDGGRTIK